LRHACSSVFAFSPNLLRCLLGSPALQLDG
jgi:hypothetical protein